ncbi:hypothetical protein [Halopseudomonas aestusnigri]|uniref:hypothetical protein n=1 Tax=Halopseudomonas aestusnigri TaxID=857252 RepID=UPI0028C268D9|nr:hypothetical protein YSKK_34060 [Halopseudomonas aestusnigri]
MKRIQCLLAAGGLLAVLPCFAGTYEWTEGWGMGVSEYSVDDGNGIGLTISCSPERGVSAGLSLPGQYISSDEQPGFDLIVDGERYSNPFFTDCRVCDANFREAFWDALREANKLKVVINERVINLPTTNLGDILPSQDDPNNTCLSRWSLPY